MGFAAVQVLAGATQLSELGIDINKNWLTYLIKNLGDPVDAQDAVTKAWVLTQSPFSGLLSALTIDTNKDWLGHLIKNLGDPTAAQDAATRAYVLAQLANYLALAGGAMAGNIAMAAHKVTGLGAPTANNDAARKKYVDDRVFSLSQSEPIRSLDVVYQNTGSTPLFVCVSLECYISADDGDLQGTSLGRCYVGDTNPPTSEVARVGTRPDISGLDAVENWLIPIFAMTFIVPPNYYYKVSPWSAGDGQDPIILEWWEWS